MIYVFCICFPRFLDDNDAELQTVVLECLLLWNDFLLPHREHLLKLIKPEELREELTTSNMSVDIEEAHRSLLFSLEIRILAPKVRTLKNLASRKVHITHFFYATFYANAVFISVLISYL